MSSTAGGVGGVLPVTAGSPQLAPDGPVRRARSPRLTVVRLFNSIVILCLGIPKAVSTAKGDSAVSNMFYWNSSVIFGLIAYWLSVIEKEQTYPEWAEWLFEQDLTGLRASWLLLTPIVVCTSFFHTMFGFQVWDWMKEHGLHHPALAWASTMIIPSLTLGLMAKAIVLAFRASRILKNIKLPKILKKYTIDVRSTRKKNGKNGKNGNADPNCGVGC